MSLDNIKMSGGVIFQQKYVDVVSDSSVELVAAVSGKRIRVFRLTLSSNIGETTFRIRTGGEKIKTLFIPSDAVFFEESSIDFRWPIFQGNFGSDLTIRQSDLTSLGAGIYFQFRVE